MKAALYTRVSTDDQNCAMQVAELTRYAATREWQVQLIEQETASGADPKRPALNRVLAASSRREVDVVLVWKLDRFGRSAMDLLGNVKRLESAGVRFIATSQGLDTDQSNPLGRFLLHVLAAVAELERELIRDRSVTGQRRYREEFARGSARSRSGKNLPIGRPKRVFRRDLIAELRQKGKPWAQIAREMKVPLSTVRRVGMA